MIKKLPFFAIYLSILMCQWGLEHFIHPNAFLLTPYKQGSFIGVENYSNIVFIDSDKSSKIYQSINEVVSNTKLDSFDIEFKLIHHEERIRSGEELGVLDIYRQANPIRFDISYKSDWFKPRFMIQKDNGLMSSGLSSSFKILPYLDFIYSYNEFQRDYHIGFSYENFSMNQNAAQIDYENSMAFNFKNRGISIYASLLQNKFKINKISSENPSYSLNSDRHESKKYYFETYFDINNNRGLKFYLQSERLDLELDFLDEDVGFIKINDVHYLSNQASISYYLESKTHNYSIGYTRKNIDVYGSLRLRTSFISPNLMNLFAPIYDTKDSGEIASNIIFFNIEKGPSTNFKTLFSISYIQDFFNIKFKNTFRNFLGFEEDSSVEEFKYTRKDAINLAIQLVKQNNSIQYGISFSQHIPIRLDSEELGSDNSLNRKGFEYGGGLVKAFIRTEI